MPVYISDICTCLAMEHLLVIILVACIRISTVTSINFIGEPEDVSAIEGKQAVLSCFLSDEVIGVLYWWNGTERIASYTSDLNVDEDIRMSISSAKAPANTRMYSLMISVVELQDEGDYHCEVQGSEHIKSGSAHLTVLQTPSSHYPQCITSRESVNVDDSITLSCVSGNIKPPVELNWTYGDGTLITSGVRSNIQGMLVYKNITFNAKKADSKGVFTCKQTSPIEILPEISVCTVENLKIFYKPVIQIQHTDIIYVGSDAILFCQSFANPPVTQYKWTTQPKLNTNEYSDDGQVFRLLIPTVANNGTQITCEGKNVVGETSDTVVLHISSKREANRIDQNIYGNNEYINYNEDVNNDFDPDDSNDHKVKNKVSLYVVIIIIVLVVIIVVVVVIIPVYYQCFCKTRTTTDSSGREIYQPTVYYDTRDRASNSGLYDRSLPRLPSLGQYGHWRHSFASQVPEDLDQQEYMYIKEDNEQNTL